MSAATTTLTPDELAELNDDLMNAKMKRVAAGAALAAHWDLLPGVNEHGSKRDHRRWFKEMRERTERYGYWTFRKEQLMDVLEADGAVDPSGCGVYAYVDADIDAQAG